MIVLESTEEEMSERSKEQQDEGVNAEILQTRIKVYQETTKKFLDDWQSDRVVKVSKILARF